MSGVVDWTWVKHTLTAVQSEQRALRGMSEPIGPRLSALEARFSALEVRLTGIEESVNGIGLTYSSSASCRFTEPRFGDRLMALSSTELDAELEALNANVDRAIAARKAWMDEHMDDYARYHLGEVLVDLDTGQTLGTVTKLYRYFGDRDPRFDTRMEIQYEFTREIGSYGSAMSDNTSRQPGLRYGTKEEYARDLEWRLSPARRIPTEPLPSLDEVRGILKDH